MKTEKDKRFESFAKNCEWRQKAQKVIETEIATVFVDEYFCRHHAVMCSEQSCGNWRSE